MAFFGVSNSTASFVDAFDSQSSSAGGRGIQFWEEIDEHDMEIEEPEKYNIHLFGPHLIQRIIRFMDDPRDFYSFMKCSKRICKHIFRETLQCNIHTKFSASIMKYPNSQVNYCRNLEVLNPDELNNAFLHRFYNLRVLKVTARNPNCLQLLWHMSKLEVIDVTVLPTLGILKTQVLVQVLNSFKNLRVFKLFGILPFQEKKPAPILEALETRPNLRHFSLNFAKQLTTNYHMEFHKDFDVDHMKGSPLVSALAKGLKEVFKKTFRFNDIFSLLLLKFTQIQSFEICGTDQYSIYFGQVLKTLKHHDTLQSLILKGITLSSVHLVLEIFPELVEWEVNGCTLKHFRGIDPGFVAHNTLERIRFMENVGALRDYVLVMNIFPKLQEIVLQRCNFKDVEFKDRLPTDYTINTLDFSSNRIRFRGLKYIVKRMRELKSLTLRNCPIVFEGDLNSKHSREKGFKQITYLDLSGCSVGIGGFFDILINFPNLTFLGLSRGKILMSENQHTALMQIPGDGTKLRKLEFCGNKITKFGLRVLLNKFENLEELCVSGCDITVDDKGFSLDVEDPKKVKKKEEVEGEGEEELKKKETKGLKYGGRKTFPSLKKLNLSLNYIKVEGLVDLFSVFTNLEYIDLNANQITPGKIVFPRYPSLKIVHLFMNLDVTTELDIEHMFRNNHQISVVSFGDDKTGMKSLYYPVRELRF